MRDVLISIPTLAYKDWRVFFNFGDEDEEDRAVRNLRREFPYRDDVEKDKRGRKLNQLKTLPLIRREQSTEKKFVNSILW